MKISTTIKDSLENKKNIAFLLIKFCRKAALRMVPLMQAIILKAKWKETLSLSPRENFQ
jgi:hypothetical protein